MKRSGRSLKSPAFQWYAPDFLSDGKTAGLNMAERGVFATLASHQWLDGPLPNDVEWLARLCHTPLAEFEELWKRVAPCFPINADGLLASKRLERERTVQAENRAERQAHIARVNAARAAAQSLSQSMPQSEHTTVSRIPYPDTRTPGVVIPPPAGAAPPRNSKRKPSTAIAVPDQEPGPAGYAETVTCYFQAFQAATGEKPRFGKPEGAAVKALLAKSEGPERAAEVITFALQDHWRVTNGRATIRVIAGEYDALLLAARNAGRQKLSQGQQGLLTLIRERDAGIEHEDPYLKHLRDSGGGGDKKALAP